MPVGTITAIVLAAAAARLIAHAMTKRKASAPGAPSGAPRAEGEEGGDQALSTAIQAVLARRMRAREAFTALAVVQEVVHEQGAQRGARVHAAALAVERLYTHGFFERNGYARTNMVFHPTGAAPAPSASVPVPAPLYSAPIGSGASAPSTHVPDASAYAAPEILGLSAEALRARALKINPWKAAAIGRRMDIIPPQSDERTALIDRGLILRGLLTPTQIVEIHRVGDLWLRHSNKVHYADSAARVSADAAMVAEKEAAAALKAEKRRQSEARKLARQAEVTKRREEDIIFLGRGVSGRLHDRRSNIEMLGSLNLPVLSSPADVARAMELTIPELRWLCFHAEAMTRPHYVYFEVKKRSGGTRLLAAPHKRLGKAQRWVFHNILIRLALTSEAHGFVRNRSTVSNAREHVGKKLVVNLDLKDFFPSISFARVLGLFQSLGYSPAVATVLALLCTEPPRTLVTHDGSKYWVAAGERRLPQGACTSPTLSNLIVRHLDRRIAGVSKRLGWTYTRYADDLSLSCGEQAKPYMGKVLASVRKIVAEEGFSVNERKGRVQRSGGRQEVTGIVVNEKLGLPRAEVRKLRAILHAAVATGLEAQNRTQRPNFRAYLEGKIGYLSMVDAAKGQAMREALSRVKA